MMTTRRTLAILTAVLAVGAVGCVSGGRYSGRSDAPPTVSLAPASMARVGSIHERYQSYNVEMVEVTGGRLWRRPAVVAVSALGVELSDDHHAASVFRPAVTAA